MAKALRTAATIVAVVVAVAAAIPSGGTSLLAAGLGVSAATASAIAAGVGLAASAIGALTAPKVSAVSTGNPEQFTADPEGFIPYMVGRTGTSGNIVFRRAWDTADKGDNDRQAFGIVLSGGGPIASIDSFTADTAAVTFNSSGAAAGGGFGGSMWQRTQLGAIPTTAAMDFGVGAGTPPGWGADRRMHGLAAATWTLKFDTKGKIYASGVPAPKWVGRGVLCYDPRKDSTFPGGSGSHRWADPANTAAFDAARATWEYSDSPFLQGLRWALGTWERDATVSGSVYVKTFGLGLPITGVDVGAFVQGANVADANAWKVSGVVYSGDDKWDSLKKMLQAGMGEPVMLGAMLSCFVNAPKVSLATINPGDVVGDASVAATQSRRDRINRVVPRYVQEAKQWQLLPGTPVAVPSYYAIDGGQRTKTVDFPLIPDADGGKQIATACRYAIEDAREFGPISLPLKLRWIGYKAGDCVTANLPELGLVNQTILFTNREFDPAAGVPTFTARSETAAKHAFALGQTTAAPPTPGVSAAPLVPVPGATAWAITAQSVSANGTTIPALVIAGAVDSPVAEAIVFEYRGWISGQPDTAGWIAAGIETPSATSKVISGVKDGTAYQCAVSYQRGGVTGGRQILGPVTAGQTSVPWSTGVSDPNGTKPANNATNSADPSSPFGPSGTINTFINRVVSVESYIAPSGALQGTLTDLQNQINNAGAHDPRTDTLVSQATFLEASVRGAGNTSPNLIINPSFGDGLNNWTPSSTSAWATVTGFDIGPFAQSGTANAYLFQDVAVSAGGYYSLSASMDPDNAQACYIKVDWLSSAGAYISTAGVNVYSDGWVRGYSADNAIQAPGNAAKARIYCTMASGASGNGRFNQVQFQRGGIPTPFRDDSTANYNGSRITSEITLRNNLAGTYATQFNNITSMFAGTQGSYLKSSIDSLSATVATNNTTISTRVDTLTSSIKALSAPNLLANGGFTNGFSGWTLSNGGSGWTIYTQYSPGIWAQYNGTDDCYAYTDVYGIQPSTNYCFSFAGSSDAQGDYAHMYVEWWTTNFGTLLGRQEIGPAQNFNRVNYGPYNTPANTAIARVGIVGRNDSGNGAGGRKWRQIQLQQSDTPTDYSDASSLQGLQAQVTTQAGTLASVSNTVNGTVLPRLSAYWQTSASVGGAQAFITAKADLGGGNTATSVAIGAQAFYVLNQVNSQWLKTFEVSGGNVMVYGNLAVAGSVSVGNLQYGAGGLYSIWYNENVATQSSTSQWLSFAQLELTPQDGQMIDGSIEFVLSSSGADTDALYRCRRDDGTIVKAPVSLRARAGGSSVSLGFIDSVPAGRDTAWYWECMKASDTVNVNMASCSGMTEEIGRGYVQHATITTAGGQGPGAGSAGGGSINGGTSQGGGATVGGGGGGGFGNSNNRQF